MSAIVLLTAGWAVTIAAAFVPIGWSAPIGVLVFVVAGLFGATTSVGAAVVATIGSLRARRSNVSTSLTWTLAIIGAAVLSFVAERVVAVLGIVLG